MEGKYTLMFTSRPSFTYYYYYYMSVNLFSNGAPHKLLTAHWVRKINEKEAFGSTTFVFRRGALSLYFTGRYSLGELLEEGFH